MPYFFHFLHMLTLVFVACKLGQVGWIATWSWWLVFTPSIFAVVVAFAAFLICCLVISTLRDM